MNEQVWPDVTEIERLLSDAAWNSRHDVHAAADDIARYMSTYAVSKQKVLVLANEWLVFPNEPAPPYKPLDAHRCATELRALIQQEALNDDAS